MVNTNRQNRKKKPKRRRNGSGYNAAGGKDYTIFTWNVG